MPLELIINAQLNSADQMLAGVTTWLNGLRHSKLAGSYAKRFSRLRPSAALESLIRLRLLILRLLLHACSSSRHINCAPSWAVRTERVAAFDEASMSCAEDELSTLVDVVPLPSEDGS